MIRQGENLFDCMSRMIATDTDPVSQHELIWERYGETVAVLVMDSSGFSRTCQDHGIIHFLSRLMQLRQLCEQVFQDNGLKELHFEADNAFAVFDDASDAVAAALDIQKAVYRAKLMLSSEERFRVSLGVGYGRLLHSETLEGYFGEEMNAASRLGEDIASGDEVLITRAAHEACHPEVVRGFKPLSIDVAGVKLDYFRHQFRPE